MFNWVSRFCSDSLLHKIYDYSKNTKTFEEYDTFYLSNREIKSQYTPYIVNYLIKDKLAGKIYIKENEISKEYKSNYDDCHGEKHIKNVVLFSSIIGTLEGLSDKELDLLLEAAKYHDIGRIGNTCNRHALKSSERASKRLEGIYTPDEINIIKTLIEFHEVRRTMDGYELFFDYIAKVNNIHLNEKAKVFKMAEMLKDADALDRTRFIGKRSRLNPKFLYYKSSKKLIKLASSINESYYLERQEKHKQKTF